MIYVHHLAGLALAGLCLAGLGLAFFSLLSTSSPASDALRFFESAGLDFVLIGLAGVSFAFPFSCDTSISSSSPSESASPAMLSKKSIQWEPIKWIGPSPLISVSLALLGTNMST